MNDITAYTYVIADVTSKAKRDRKLMRPYPCFLFSVGIDENQVSSSEVESTGRWLTAVVAIQHAHIFYLRETKRIEWMNGLNIYRVKVQRVDWMNGGTFVITGQFCCCCCCCPFCWAEAWLLPLDSQDLRRWYSGCTWSCPGSYLTTE